jgi:putative endonuclease
MHYLYILRSKKDGNHYVGITSDLEKRLKYHNSGQVRSTKRRIPFNIIYSEKFDSVVEARVREVYLKSYKGSGEKFKIIENCGIV